jgi:hypothetical protein
MKDFGARFCMEESSLNTSKFPLEYARAALSPQLYFIGVEQSAEENGGWKEERDPAKHEG